MIEIGDNLANLLSGLVVITGIVLCIWHRRP